VVHRGRGLRDNPGLRGWLDAQDINYVMAVSCDAHFTTPTGAVRADELAASAPKRGWQRLSCGAGSKGDRLYDWLCGSPEHPCLIQTVSEWAIVDGVPREMVKVHAYEAVECSADQRRAAVVLATLTCADNQVESVFDGFLSFFDGIAAEPPTTS
jgi:hypothetical protein